MFIRPIAPLIGLFLLTAAARAEGFTWQPPKTNSMEDLSGMLDEMRGKLDVPALAAAVVHKEQILGAGAVGVRKFGELQKVTLEDKFHIGSITKSMTALIAVLFEQEGKVEFDATAASVLKDWEFPEPTDKITLRMLLQNRSGLPTKAPRDLWAKAWEAGGDKRVQRESFLQGVVQKPLEAEPGTKYIYSNQGFALAGAMLEKVAGRPWEQLAQERIFAPLGLHSAGFHAPDAEGKLEQPWGHRRNDEGIFSIPPRDNPPAIAPAGAVHASILDIARYAAFHMQAAAGKVPDFKDSVDELYTPAEGQSYAFGWATGERKWAGGKILNHTGSNTMFFTVLWIAPETQYAFVVASNIGDESARDKCDQVVAALIRKYIN